MMDKRGIKQLVYEVAPDIIAMRRHIHGKSRAIR